MATAALLRSLRRRDVASAPLCAYRSLSGTTKPSHLVHNWTSLSRPFSSMPAGSNAIGIDVGTTNSFVTVMEGKNPKAIEVSLVGGMKRVVQEDVTQDLLSIYGQYRSTLVDHVDIEKASDFDEFETSVFHFYFPSSYLCFVCSEERSLERALVKE